MKPLMVLNVVLAALLGLAAWSVVEGWREFDENVAEGSGVDTAGAAAPPTFVESAGPAPVDSGVIARSNPFSVDRSSAVAALEAPPVPTGARPYLFGTIRIGDDRMAMMAPSSATNRNEYRPFRVGQSIGGWQLVEIEEKSVVVASGGGRQTITINDPSARLPRVRQEARQTPASNGPQVSTVGAAPKGPGAATPAAEAPASSTGQPAATPGMRTIMTPFSTKAIQRPAQ
jgi:hypothetical protein